MKPKQICVICGALVRNQNPKTVTCDPICTAAKKNGLTRSQQIRRELRRTWFDDSPMCPTCGMYSAQCDCWDSINHV